MIIGVVLPVLAWLLAYEAFKHRDARPLAARRAVVSASIAVGVAVFAITEGLSAVHALTEVGMLVAWLALDGALLALNVRLGWRVPRRRPTLGSVTRLEIGLIAACALVGVVTLLIAVTAAPNNWDAMTYHMARVGYWVQSGSVDYHAAYNLNRDYQGPLASYAMLDLFLLGRGDQLVNIVDWASFVGAIVVASLIAAEIGAGRTGQALAALFVATLPMGILQATSSQNHILVAFWILCGVAIVLDQWTDSAWPAMVEAGAAVGLAILTKGSAYAFIGPFLFWAALVALRTFGWGAIARLALLGSVALALNVPSLVRNVGVFGSPLGPSTEIAAMFVPSAITPGTLAERALQETSLQLGTPFRPLDRIVTEVFSGTASALGLDLNDPRITQPTAPWEVPHMSLVEDNAGNALAFFAIIVVVALVIARHRGRPRRYLLATAASCLLYLALLRYTIWNSRWSLSLFILAAPLVGVALGRMRGRAVALIALILVAASTPWLLRSYDRPLVGAGSVLTTARTTQYFAMRPELEAPYAQVAAEIGRSGCRDVGFVLRQNEAWEYPLWRILNPSGHEVGLRDVLVSNQTSVLEDPAIPCMLVSFGGPVDTSAAYPGISFVVTTTTGPLTLYSRRT